VKIFGSPNRYIQGNGILDRLGEILSPLGDRFFIFGDETVLSIVGDRIASALKSFGKTFTMEKFRGECCYPEIFRLKKEAEKNKAEVVIGIGGGKASDTTKALSIQLKLPIVIIPTIAATDAPTSHLVALYDEDHVIKEVLRMEPHASLVVVDTGVIAQAPARFLVAGMGDALSTKFEAEACWKSGTTNLFKAKPFHAALHLATLAYEIIIEYGEEAKRSVENREVTPALENVVEANILLSGLGFESGGLAAAHAVHAGFTLIPEMNQSLHGEKVAFGILVQLMLENRELDFIMDLIRFYKRIGLPTSLKELGLREFRLEQIERAANRICQKGSYIYNMPFEVDNEAIIEAILKADSLAKNDEV
jgi:glycerol dehydrogenase